MLLKTRRSRAVRSDQGSALIPVLAVVAVGLIVTGMLSSSIVGGIRFASSTRAGIQSQAAADAGVVAARAGLYKGTCQSNSGTYASTGTLTYSAKVQRMFNGAWQDGCPAYLTPQVRILSTGRAVDSAGTPVGTPTNVEAVYTFLWPGVTPSGVAMYFYSGGNIEANSSLDLSESPGAGLVVKNGTFVCDKNNTVINGNVIITGSLDFGNNDCDINGSAWVSGAVTLGSKGSISGDLSAGSVSPNPPGSRVGGTFTLGGPLPTTANWTDVGYTPADWVDSTGIPYQVVTLSGATCTQSGGAFGGIAGQPTIVNALACPNGIQVSNNTTFRLTSDVVVFAPKFTWGAINSLKFESFNTTQRRIWFITPDNVADVVPTCQPSQGDFAVNNSFDIRDTVNAMLYTPCAFDGKNGFTWRGQMYSGTFSYVNNNPSFDFSAIGIAGYDLSSGTRSTPITTPQPGSLVSNRNISSVP